jgi:hypothetical protein
MAGEMDFPLAPYVGQRYTNSIGIVYQWNGVAWVISYYDASAGGFGTVGNIVGQIRTLLQDTDITGGVFRYSTDGIIQNINQGLLELYRLRPDVFLELDFQVPIFPTNTLDSMWPLEDQWIPPIVYFAAGLTQMRDEEGTQDNRANLFMSRFTSSVMSVTT